MNCHNHPDRAGRLTIDLPSLGIRTFMCEECRTKLSTTLSAYKGKREAWEVEGDWHKTGNDYYVMGAGGYLRAEHNPTDREWK